MTEIELAGAEQLAQQLSELAGCEGTEALSEKINSLMPGLRFTHVVTRGNWYRLGGVVDAAHRPVSGNIAQWAEQVSAGDVERLLAEYADSGYFATRLAGKTHYFSAPSGEAPEAFIQLEIEELREVLDRPLIEKDWYPESIEEFLDPLDYPRLAPEPVAETYFQFRRITPVERLLREAPKENRSLSNLKRFFKDWSTSSANEFGPFCDHWALALREYIDRDGECRLSAKPFSTFRGNFDSLSGAAALHGVELANLIHGYDRQIGYPFAWYFNMLGSKSENYTVAEAVLRDQMGAYDYIPAKDLKVLRAWEERPYGV
ncbi:MAG: hypothetical protein P8166_08620 [Candidatus Thiodiazotropha sp.]